MMIKARKPICYMTIFVGMIQIYFCSIQKHMTRTKNVCQMAIGCCGCESPFVHVIQMGEGRVEE